MLARSRKSAEEKDQGSTLIESTNVFVHDSTKGGLQPAGTACA